MYNSNLKYALPGAPGAETKKFHVTAPISGRQDLKITRHRHYYYYYYFKEAARHSAERGSCTAERGMASN